MEAPTATGKSFIVREVVRSALEKAKPGPHAYLVPFRSLANEIRLHSHRLSPDGVHAEVFSSGKVYEVTLGVTGIECTCPAASRYYRGSVCKHQACAIHDLLFASGIDSEVRTRAIYYCGHVFGKTLDVGTRLDQTLRILTAWGMVEHVPGGFRVTKLGEVASTSGLDLLFVRQAVLRIASSEAADYRDVAGWAVEDYLAEEKYKEKWLAAVRAWLDEVDVRKISHPARYRGDFEQRIEDLSRVCLLYEKAAEALGKPRVAKAAHAASLCLRYGVAPEVVPLMALGFHNLRRARSRYLYEKGIRGLEDLRPSLPIPSGCPKPSFESGRAASRRSIKPAPWRRRIGKNPITSSTS